MDRLLLVRSSPHIRTKNDVYQAMRLVILALLPALAGSIYFYGSRAVVLLGAGIISAIAFELLGNVMFRRPISLADGSAIVTGILLAFNLPPAVPFWIPVVGSGFAILIVKQFFGGLGYNFVNPALAGRAFLMASWPTLMTKAWLAPRAGTLSGFDAITNATPLNILRYGGSEVVSQLSHKHTLFNLFLGREGGCLGETSALLLLCGGIFLLILGIIDYRIVVGYLGSVMVLALALPTKASVFFHLLSGGLMLGALFMATDWVTSPVTKQGRWIFGTGCGVLTMMIRLWGGYPEGVCYAILLMNLFAPLIDRYTKGKRFGEVRST